MFYPSCKKLDEASQPTTEQNGIVETNEIFNKQNLLKGTRIDQVKYKETKLLQIAKAIFSINRNASFQNLLYTEIEKKIDGDYNVLIDQILSMSNIMSLENLNILKNSENSFKNIEGNNYYAQIFIPFYEQKKKDGKIDENSIPIIALLNDDDTILDGYKLNAKGQIEKLSFKIDETYAKNNNVWVLSLNERIFSDATLKELKNNKKGKISSSPLANTRFKIENLNIKAHYEGWAAGANDIYMAAFYGNANLSLIGGYPLRKVFFGTNNCYIRDVSKSDINKDLMIDWTVDRDASPWSAADVGNYMYFNIYEDDNWPAPWQINSIPNNNSTEYVNIDFRSYDNSYFQGRVLDTDVINGITINNTLIKLNFKLR